MIKELTLEAIPRLRKIANGDFPFPDLLSGLYCSQKGIYSEGKFIGCALLKLTSEAMLILDRSESDLVLAKAIGEAFVEVPKEMDKFGLDQVHVFVLPETNEKYAQFLMKNFKFEKASGIPLVYTRK